MGKSASWPAQGRLAERPETRPGLDADSSHAFDMLALELDYRVENEWQAASGIATLTLVARESSPVIRLNAEGLTIFGVNENDSALPFTHISDTVTVNRPVQAGDTVTIWFNLSIPVQPDHHTVGYHWGIGGVFTFSEPYGARRWFPCWDQPFDKFSRVTVAVNMPEYWSLAANGRWIETTFPEFGRKREIYVLTAPISSYLVMLTCGTYSKIVFEQNAIQYRYFVWPQDSMWAVYDWARTPQMVEHFGRLFGPYPFAEYGMVQAELFDGWGAMEHETFTTMGYHLLEGTRMWEGIVAHELAHQWFGDALTPVDFRNMWLNEGFATYAHALWFEEIGGRDSLRNILARFAEDYFTEDRTSRYPAYDPPPDYLFGLVIYHKSAWVLHMLREQLMGDSLFFAGLRAYTARFRYGTVDTEDFIQVMSETYGQDLHWYFAQWIYAAGFPELEITITPRVPSDLDVTVRVQQVQTNAPIFRIPVSIDVNLGSTVTRTVWVTDQDQMAVISFDPGSVIQSAQLTPYQPLLYQGTGAAAPERPRAPPLAFALGDPYPNPFNPTITIPIELRQTARVTVDLFDIQGQIVASVLDEERTAGHHLTRFTADNIAGGIYFVRLRVGEQSAVKKILFLK
jgi:aminopeptidase N